MIRKSGIVKLAELMQLCLFAIVIPCAHSFAQSTVERDFVEPKSTVEKSLRSLQPTSGPLPTLEGFVTGDPNRLSQFERGYYACSIVVESNLSGGSRVRVRAKITAWHPGSDAAKAGYQVLPSNGRVEADLLDRLGDAMGEGTTTTAVSKPSGAGRAPQLAARASASGANTPTISAPVPQLPSVNSPLGGSLPANRKSAPASADNSQREFSDRHLEALLAEAKSLDEILRNQSHPTNLVAVKKNGAPVLSSPAEGAKTLFTASPEDEFEMIDQNASWVHVRILGLSRGWIRRDNLEMPDEAAQNSTSAPSDVFHETNNQIVPFPGDWEPLKGKTVKLVSVQAADNVVVGWRAKLDYAKTIFQKDYAVLAASGGESGEVLIFDAQDGGMIAATLDNVKKWRDGVLTDDAFWKVCYFDPPETFGAQASQ